MVAGPCEVARAARDCQLKQNCRCENDSTKTNGSFKLHESFDSCFLCECFSNHPHSCVFNITVLLVLLSVVVQYLYNKTLTVPLTVTRHSTNYSTDSRHHLTSFC